MSDVRKQTPHHRWITAIAVCLLFGSLNLPAATPVVSRLLPPDSAQAVEPPSLPLRETARFAIRLRGPDPLTVVEVNGRAMPAGPAQAGAPAAEADLSSIVVRENERTIFASATAGEILIEADGFGSWSALLPVGAAASVEVSFATKTLNLRTPATAAPVQIRFSDGATGTVRGGSMLHLDVFNDDSYSVSGEGQIQATTADGIKVAIDRAGPPLTGGPLVGVVTAQGERRLKRLTPTVEAIFASAPDGKINLISSGQVTKLGSEPEERTFSNGALLHLEPQRDPGQLSWRVKKGDFLFRVAGVDGWRAHGWTGQAATFTWDPAGPAVDVRNDSAEGSIIVALASQTFARVEPGATFQYLRMGPATFAGSAAGGRVSLYNSMNKTVTELPRTRLTFRAGVALQPNQAKQLNPIAISWRDGAVEVQESVAKTKVVAGTKRIFTGNSGGQLRVSVENGGQLNMQALSGDFAIEIRSGQQLDFLVAEGNSVDLQLSAGGSLLAGSASPDNSSPIQIVGIAGTAVLLPPGEKVPFVMWNLGLPGLGMETVSSTPLESTGAPSTAESSSTSVAPSGVDAWRFGRSPQEVFTPRVSQPPVSIVR